MGDPIWRWSATGARGWAEEPIDDLVAQPALSELLDELRHWTNYLDPAFLVWQRDGWLLACVSDLAMSGRDRAGRPERARCLVVADQEHVPEVLAQLAGLIRNGLPPGFIVSDPGPELGFRVSARSLPPPLAGEGSSAGVGSSREAHAPPRSPEWPEPGRQKRLPGVALAADWLAAAAVSVSQDRSALPGVFRRGGAARVAMGSPLLADSTVHLATDYALVAGPGLHHEEVMVRDPKGDLEPRSTNLPVLHRRPTALLVAVILAIVMGAALLGLLLAV